MATISSVGSTVTFELDYRRIETGLRGYVEVKLNSQSKESRSSYLTVKFYLYTTGNPISNVSWYNRVMVSPNYTDMVEVEKTIDYIGSAKVLVSSGNFTIQHNTDGTCNATLQSYLWNKSSPSSSTSSDTQTETLRLPDLPVSIPFHIQNDYIYTTTSTVNITIYTGTADPSWTYTMTLRNSNGDTYVLFNNLATNYWSGVLPNEVNALFPNSSSATIYFDLAPKTAAGVTLSTYTVYKTVSVGTRSGPTISNIHDYAVTAGGASFSGGHIAGVSYLKLTMHCQDFSGSVVNNIKAVINGREVTVSPQVSNEYTIISQYPIATSGSLVVPITATNNRGYTTTVNYTVSNIAIYASPDISIFSVIRSDASGNAVSESRNIKVVAKLSVRSSLPSLTNRWTWVLHYKQHEGSNTWTQIETQSGNASTSGNITEVTINKVYQTILPNASTPYDIRLTVYDSILGSQNSVSRIVVTGVDQVILDFKEDGTGAAVGTTAVDSGIFDIGWATRFSGGLYPKILTAVGTSYNMNSLKSPGFYYYSTSYGGSITNLPTGITGNYGITVFPTGVSSVLQILVPEAVGTAPSMYLRTLSSNSQASAWTKVVGT